MVALVGTGLMPTSPPKGFSLIEVLVTLAIVAIALSGLMSITFQRSHEQILKMEFDRLEQLLKVTTERAVLLGREHRVVMNAIGYHADERFQGQWRTLDTQPFKQYRWSQSARPAAIEQELRIAATGDVSEKEVIFVAADRTLAVRISALGQVHRSP